MSGSTPREWLGLVLGRQAKGSQQLVQHKSLSDLHSRQPIHLRISQAELQVNTLGSLFAVRRWGALLESG